MEFSSAAFRRNREIIDAPVGEEELVMLSVDSGRYYSVNAVGRRVWELLEQPRTMRELCAAIAGEFDVDEKTCLADFGKFVRDLMNNGMILAYDP